jgi:hypothetical protein
LLPTERILPSFGSNSSSPAMVASEFHTQQEQMGRFKPPKTGAIRPQENQRLTGAWRHPPHYGAMAWCKKRCADKDLRRPLEEMASSFYLAFPPPI